MWYNAPQHYLNSLSVTWTVNETRHHIWVYDIELLSYTQGQNCPYFDTHYWMMSTEKFGQSNLQRWSVNNQYGSWWLTCMCMFVGRPRAELTMKCPPSAWSIRGWVQRRRELTPTLWTVSHHCRNFVSARKNVQRNSALVWSIRTVLQLLAHHDTSKI